MNWTRARSLVLLFAAALGAASALEHLRLLIVWMWNPSQNFVSPVAAGLGWSAYIIEIAGTLLAVGLLFVLTFRSWGRLVTGSWSVWSHPRSGQGSSQTPPEISLSGPHRSGWLR